MEMNEMAHDAVTTVLVEKIQRQATRIAALEAELRGASSASVHVMLGQLRARQANLLYVGTGHVDGFIREIADEFGSEVATSVSNSLFVLDNAPVSFGVRDALRSAIKQGLNRW
jgi:hypothetical protein